jgi:hypothetical protein
MRSFNEQLRQQLSAANIADFRLVRYAYVLENQRNEFLVTRSDDAGEVSPTYGICYGKSLGMGAGNPRWSGTRQHWFNKCPPMLVPASAKANWQGFTLA